MKAAALLAPFALLLAACSFDYSDVMESSDNKPDVVMENIEYVRVEGGSPLVRFSADYAERWESRQTMELREFSFEYLEDDGNEINAEGGAFQASVQLDTGNVSLSGGVRINIESEDITISTDSLRWLDDPRLLYGPDHDEVDIERSDGTSFTGRGLSVNIRDRTWSFSGEVGGTYIEKDDEDDENENEETETNGLDGTLDDIFAADILDGIFDITGTSAHTGEGETIQ